MSRRKPSSPCSKSRTEAAGEIGLYLHLPFCLSKCAYCDFESVPLAGAGGLPTARRYLDALFVECDRRAASEEFAGATVETVYLGGGTPSILPPEWLAEALARVAARFDCLADMETTVEANPGTVGGEQLAALREAGFNRLSLGLQSCSEAVLQTLGRSHRVAEGLAAARAAREAGWRNLNVDLIYGVPRQSLEEWQDTLREVISLQPEHVSAYGLSVEPGTPLAAEIQAGRLCEPEEDLYAEMYLAAETTFAEAGYEHYEISNYARPGFACRHNRRYWLNAEYLGLGVGAHSHRRGLRWNNRGPVGVYIDRLERGQMPVLRAEALAPQARVGEALMLGLRQAEGVSEQAIAERYGIAPREVFGPEIEQLAGEGLLIAEEGRLRIPRDKWLVSNEALGNFIA